jgi:hypothetical protein
MKRETVKIKDLAKNDKYPDHKDLCIDDWDTCGTASRIEKNFDAEKGFVDYEIVIQRWSDGKYFKFTYTQFGHNGDDILEQTGVEVFPKTIEVVVYE